MHAAPLLILGMRRSGTSCLAGSLEAAGLYLGNVSTRDAHNRKGNREPRGLWRLNDALLEANGGKWNDPPDGSVDWTPTLRDQAERHVEKLRGHGPWGIKDPRLLLMLAPWEELIGEVRLVASIRHPTSVAQSLLDRYPDKDIGWAVGLWKHYNTKLLDLARHRRVRIIRYDRREADYKENVVRLAGDLALPHPEKATDFFEHELMHQKAAVHHALPPEVSELFDALCALAEY